MTPVVAIDKLVVCPYVIMEYFGGLTAKYVAPQVVQNFRTEGFSRHDGGRGHSNEPRSKLFVVGHRATDDVSVDLSEEYAPWYSLIVVRM